MTYRRCYTNLSQKIMKNDFSKYLVPTISFEAVSLLVQAFWFYYLGSQCFLFFFSKVHALLESKVNTAFDLYEIFKFFEPLVSNLSNSFHNDSKASDKYPYYILFIYAVQTSQTFQ